MFDAVPDRPPSRPWRRLKLRFRQSRCQFVQVSLYCLHRPLASGHREFSRYRAHIVQRAEHPGKLSLGLADQGERRHGLALAMIGIGSGKLLLRPAPPCGEAALKATPGLGLELGSPAAGQPILRR